MLGRSRWLTVFFDLLRLLGVTSGLKDLPLVPVEDSEELLPLSCCRNPDSVLMSQLGK